MSTTIDDVLCSLWKRGFYTGPEEDKIQEQTNAVLEELGEVARLLRRDSQGKRYLMEDMRKEVCDVIIAAICLGGRVLGDALPAAIAAKCTADEARGYLHMGGPLDETMPILSGGDRR